MTFAEIAENFELLDDWEDRYRYLIELGRTLAPLSEEEHTLKYKVRGCASQVWLVMMPQQHGNNVRLLIRGDSDAHIVRGLIALLLALYSGKNAGEILAIEEKAAFARLGLFEHLTPQRSNGLASMVARIKSEAQAILTADA